MFGVPSALSPYLTPGGMYESVSLYSIWGKKQVKQVFFFKNCLTLEQVKFYFISKSTIEFSPTFKTLAKCSILGERIKKTTLRI